MRLKTEMLTGLDVRKTRADKYVSDLNATLPEHHIDTPLRISHFLAQVLHESALMKVVKENLNYSAEGLLKVFRKYFKTQAQAQRYARKPKMIANKVYGGRMGNGDEASGDGYRYRGRGLIQLTGKNNYRKFSEWVGEDLVAQPDRVATDYAVHSAVYFWTSKKLNNHPDADDVRKVTKIINGGYRGLSERKEILHKAKELFGFEVEKGLKVVEGATYKVTATTLRFRSQPKVSPATVIGSLRKGTRVKKVASAAVPGWARVRVIFKGELRKGFVATKHLQRLIPPR